MLWTAELSISSDLSEGSGVRSHTSTLASIQAILPALQVAPFLSGFTLHSIHFVEVIECIASQPFTGVKGSKAGFPLLFIAVKRSEGCRAH
jgi:hypothetical protein